MSREPEDPPEAAFRICMVCTGNICRSPMAEIVLRDLVEKAGLSGRVVVTSAGTGEWHVGEHADPRTVASLKSRGYDGSTHRARQFDPAWFDSLDLVVALDRSHERVLRSWARTEEDRQKVRLLLSFDADPAGRTDVPDPYYSDAAMFDSVLALIEHADQALFRQLEPAFRQPAAT
ncbi:low molecular weight phosphotyrosine protein phosphatase [Herbiconiux sp. CPCC 205716]|uniref:protein-tyrosine-phosphatase n=1 Tax=Herbiconiux gentiana TaxID=2970912 RepID=A0ABT2GI01_9MICO|nr:low molecular weight protein-tyrosine-phosphatase [Herbiconiux gentiana]MCS5715854.1 low molecular weight phosphotyrosine protein phosphatase [Herbiconiux gentiana]